MKLIAVITFFSLCLPMTSAFADGMPIGDDGRFNGGPTTVITLTASQIEALATPENRWQRITLTESQRAKLNREAGHSPRRFRFYDTRIGESDCTCEAANRALRFSETEAEIPHDYLVSDEKAASIDKYH